jgi:hypothetical protein
MVEETLHHRGTTLVRRLILAPGEAVWSKNSICLNPIMVAV